VVRGTNRHGKRSPVSEQLVQRQENPRHIAQLLGVHYVELWEGYGSDERTRTYTFRSDSLTVVPLEGYRYLVRNITIVRKGKKIPIVLGSERWDVSLDSAKILFVPASGAGSSFFRRFKRTAFASLQPAGLARVCEHAAASRLVHLSVVQGNMRMQIYLTEITIDVKTAYNSPAALTMDIVVGPGIK